jgi:RNA polymerase sigma-70 factor (ECF subfamily)
MTGPSQVERLWREYGGWLLSYAVSYLGDHAAGEDVLQSVFTRLLDKGVPPGIESAKAWLSRSVRNESLNSLRSRKRVEPGRDHYLGLPVDNPHDRAVTAELRGRIESALGTLTEEQRETVILKIWGDLSFPEIASVIGVSEDAAEHRYYRGLESLEEKLEPPHE